ncbi:programmed cell death protein 7-like [Artemia franciscana]|uniref:programmed cell death protein 7-like n=1 Tax=Artemia franciscana TaxID=6661 RepID=UPI0032DA0B02
MQHPFQTVFANSQCNIIDNRWLCDQGVAQGPSRFSGEMQMMKPWMERQTGQPWATQKVPSHPLNTQTHQCYEKPKFDINSLYGWDRLVTTRKSLQNILDNRILKIAPIKKSVTSFSNDCKLVEYQIRNLRMKLNKLRASILQNEWSELIPEIESLKANLSDSLANINIKNVQYKEKARKAIKKRKWKKKRAEEIEENRIYHQKCWKQKEDEIDKKLKEEEKQLLKEKNEEETKREADLILLEVKNKKSDVQQRLEVLEVLSRLRKAKIDVSLVSGKDKDPVSDKKFAEKKDQLVSLLQSRLKSYEKEEATLRVMLEPDDQLAKTTSSEPQHSERDDLHRSLFGMSSPGNHLETLNDLIQVRQEWDQYLVPQGIPLASQIPTSWVYPGEPSNQEWEQHLKSA